jgi:hypothetical protein
MDFRNSGDDHHQYTQKEFLQGKDLSDAQAISRPPCPKTPKPQNPKYSYLNIDLLFKIWIQKYGEYLLQCISFIYLNNLVPLRKRSFELAPASYGALVWRLVVVSAGLFLTKWEQYINWCWLCCLSQASHLHLVGLLGLLHKSWRTHVKI